MRKLAAGWKLGGQTRTVKDCEHVLPPQCKFIVYINVIVYVDCR